MAAQRLHQAFRALSFTLVMILGFSSASVLAHAHLKQQSPEAEASLTKAPSKISLKFSEGIELKFSKIKLSDADNSAVETGTLLLDANDNTRIIAPLNGDLPPGKYNVNWNVVSIDGHKTKGNYSFTVKP